ncbi:MAG: heavy metal translocating P-type ATPase [Candidatus Cloacimonetes bacterium]|nr:heavy metal translocating P-type ATPase [Candidatus Cloacimonadota bacterium]
MKKYILENLNCGHCAGVIEETLRKQSFVQAVSIDFSTASMLIDTAEMGKVNEIIKSIEPDVTAVEFVRNAESITADKSSFHPRKELFFTLCCLVLFAFAMVYHHFLAPNSPAECAEDSSFLSITRENMVCMIIFVLTYLVSGYRVLYKAFVNIRHGGFFDENCLMTIATIGAFGINRFEEAAGVMIFYKVGEFLQELSIHRSRKSIKALLEVRPDYANIMIDEKIVQISPDLVDVGAEIIVKAGEKIPLDGTIISGSAQIDTSALTGESVPRTYKENDDVLAGMINQTGLLTIKVNKLFMESSIAKILDLVENAVHKKAKTEMFFTTFAKYYTPIIIGLALFTAFAMPFLSTGAETEVKDWVYRSLVMLMISCPCALVVSIPLTYFGAIGSASRKGILIKGSSVLDTLKRVKNIVFDKTGTLTKGVFCVQEIVTFNDFTEADLLASASAVEAQSNHPIAQSILQEFRSKYPDMQRNDAINDFKEVAGLGISAVLNENFTLIGNARLMKQYGVDFTEFTSMGTVVYVTINNTFAGYIVIGDEIKAEALPAIKDLQQRGVGSIFVLSGDNEKIVTSISQKLEITKFYADLLPEDKVKILQEIIDNTPQKDKTIFVGDGINDAPVLALADIGISMGNVGSDAAIETADIVLMNDSLTKIPELLDISSSTRNIIVQNIVIALGIKSLFLVLGFLGMAQMWEAVFADVGVTLLAVLNAGRILRK